MPLHASITSVAANPAIKFNSLYISDPYFSLPIRLVAHPVNPNAALAQGSTAVIRLQFQRVNSSFPSQLLRLTAR
jgi:hypothetical protein